MDIYGNRSRVHRQSFLSAEGTIAEIESFGRSADGCRILIKLENQDGNVTEFVISADTYVADFTTLTEGMEVQFYYRTDVPVPLIYPPRYPAAVVVPKRSDGLFVTVGYFNGALINEEQTLQVNLDSNVEMITPNNQKYLGSPAHHSLVVFYRNSTRSIPAQTTPEKIVVLCR